MTTGAISAVVLVAALADCSGSSSTGSASTSASAVDSSTLPSIDFASAYKKLWVSDAVRPQPVLAMNAPALQARGVVKHFTGTPAL